MGNARAYAVTGRNEASTLTVLTPVDNLEAGRPYIYICDDAEALFLESGTKLVQPKPAENGMAGFFKNYVGKGSYILVDGTWRMVTEQSGSIGNNRAYIKSLNDIPVVEVTGDMTTLPIAPDPTAISAVAADSATDNGYTIGGVKATETVRGLIIKGGKKIVGK